MTRTERSKAPHALTKDRHVSKSGMDRSLRKAGGGAHNWGSPLDVYDDAELYDEGLDEEQLTAATTNANVQAAAEASPKDRRRSSVSASSTEEHATVNNEEKEKALAFRKRALSKGDIDLSAIARTSAAVSTAK
ncbi:hypothetical protein M407DRAFT_244684 [Tulasnella calospora MUT 4182]|uniref:Hyaluronan/mRNA-binding protein domain-containing protein n=1 Tax=Tulasnella calospora MUT 4182 TaxID=1051891 RepID=A0A0C3KQR7_9AGAM|nr:hypothetical protein M407DRAFT_247065 [Tulasnella calospora MUT 4182]KIO23758.1 hypothetical protein M407DRAFT_244684 [Tulasnella calospora MUT 4182]